MEGLNSMIKKANRDRLIRDFKAVNNVSSNLEITHLLYADDSLVFCDAKEEQVYTINEVTNIQRLAGVLGCQVRNLPTTYLWMPLRAKNRSQELWNEVLERCEKKLAIWKGNYLSLGWRITLVNSVLDVLPTYMMSLFPIPVKVEIRVDALRRKFIWQGKKEKKAYNLWLWRFSLEDQALWRKVICEKYGADGRWCTAGASRPYGVSVWKSIRNLWPGFISNVRNKVGNDNKTSFWNDDWIGNGPLKEVFPYLFTIVQQPQTTVAEVWSMQGWNVTFRRFLNDWEVTRVIEFYKLLDGFKGITEEEDMLIWKETTEEYIL
uniref:Uncharacterized protein n=1 Tax=Nicotiana tabacum TaxID=4097 RepID=A0A1S4A1V2_TOBAC|nr:PREDICTED: uncharacterized protein LOC107792821 [Nicotiana tabacum]